MFATLFQFLTGFINGFILLIAGGTLNYWLSAASIEKNIIGFFSFISIPYAINMLWAPFIDTIKLPFFPKHLNHKISWIFSIHVLLGMNVLILSCIDPKINILLFAIVAMVVSFLSATQDVVVGSIRADAIFEKMHATSASIYITGYRFGMLLSGSITIMASSYIVIGAIYKVFGVMILLFPFLINFLYSKLTIKEQKILPVTKELDLKLSSILRFISSSLNHLGGVFSIFYILIFLVLYRLPDNFITNMFYPFLLEKGFTPLQISIVKLFGTCGAIIGGIIGSFIINRSSMIKCLLIFGIFHSISHLMLIIQDAAGNNMNLLLFVIFSESITGGMAMCAYIAFITSLCSSEHKATQYSVFTAMMGLSRSIIPSISGIVANNSGWSIFYFIAFILTIPSLMMIRNIKSKIDSGRIVTIK